MMIRQKLGMILENKVVRKLKLENNVLGPTIFEIPQPNWYYIH